ncbi:hypothetical protein VI817_003662 [Penicillium citrinum]|nr:hypothetical protein VI817_003662 [Penicillium citrinum]
MAAIELIHKQHVRWTKERVVSCDGGGGPLGHPKIFINTDKPEIVPCGYCGVPFVRFILCTLIRSIRAFLIRLQAHEHHRAYLKSLPASSFPLEPTEDPAEVNESQRVTDGGLEQR